MGAPKIAGEQGILNARIATIISILVAAAIGAAIVVYRDVGTLSERVNMLQRDAEKLSERERQAFGKSERMDERMKAVEARP